MEEEKIAQGTYDFRNMRKDGYRYVDKTALLYPLVTRGMDVAVIDGLRVFTLSARHAWDGLLLLYLPSAALRQVAHAFHFGMPLPR